MAVRVDILLNDDGSMQVANGDFVIGQSDAQNGRFLLVAEPGSLRQNPLVGVGIRKFINAKMNGNSVLSLKKIIRLQYDGDGYTITQLAIPAVINDNASNININFS